MTHCTIDDNSYYNYCPSTGAAILFSVIFGLTTLTHFIQAIIYRKKFCWVIIMAGSWETAGFILRVFSSRDVDSTAFGLPSVLLILLSPLWVNAFDYMVLGRMVYYYVPEKTLGGVRASRFAVCFVLLDICAFIVQGVGGSMASGQDSSSTVKLGLHIYMGGIGIQEFFLLIFCILAMKMYRDLNKGRVVMRQTSWKTLLLVLFASLSLITVRIIYRLIEFSLGVESVLTRNEAFFYCLEALPMAAAMAIFNFWHPGKFLVGPESEFPKKVKAKKDRKTKKGKEKETIEMFSKNNKTS